MEKAIKLSIEGGFNYNKPISFVDSPFLNPEFWKCLGKACGWKHVVICNDCNGERKSGRYDLTCNKREECNLTSYSYMDGWRYYWHRFIDALSEGRTPDDFFKEIL